MNSISVIVPVFDAERTIARCVSSVCCQQLDPDWSKEVIIVDDGSVDKTLDIVKELNSQETIVIRHESNRGRAAARNSGASEATGRVLMFLDADCYLLGDGVLNSHVQAILGGADLSVGILRSGSSDFWGLYEDDVYRSWKEKMSNGELSGASSANVAMNAALWEDLGGYEEKYRSYGFEDRDLFVSAEAVGARAVLNRTAIAVHDSKTSVDALVRKFQAAGHWSSGLFRMRHPEAYSRMSYARFDVREYGPMGRMALRVLAMLARTNARVAARAVEIDALPFPLKRLLVRGACTTAFLRGTVLSLAAGGSHSVK